ncbi:MAG: hypothetical protein JWO25_3731 [Alphaproteobacteria bacterium]|nr:hypothetical protein [Alphaproteobacteria bacterium]
MDKESVRALKAEMAEQVVRPLLSDSKIVRSFGISPTSLRNVTAAPPGIALGIASGNGQRDYRLAVRVQRRTLQALPDLRARFEEQTRGEVDLRYIGRLEKRQLPWYQTRRRPVQIGCSIGHYAITAGTLGALLRHNPSGETVILSNNHVLADEDRATVGDDILQPGRYDLGGRPADVVGTLLDAVPLQPRGNLVDAAIARLAGGIDPDRLLLEGAGALAGVRDTPIEPGDAAIKIGRTTGLTHGIVTAVELDDVVVGYDVGDLSFDRQIEIEGTGASGFSAGGDSGSLIMDSEFRAFGLLFAGGDSGGSNGQGLTFANELATVLARLDLSLAP